LVNRRNDILGLDKIAIFAGSNYYQKKTQQYKGFLVVVRVASGTQEYEKRAPQSLCSA
jgi:hypothetical protein